MMNEYQKLLVLLSEYDQQFKEGSINKEEYNKKMDSLIVSLIDIDDKLANNLFLDFLSNKK